SHSENLFRSARQFATGPWHRAPSSVAVFSLDGIWHGCLSDLLRVQPLGLWPNCNLFTASPLSLSGIYLIDDVENHGFLRPFRYQMSQIGLVYQSLMWWGKPQPASHHGV